MKRKFYELVASSNHHWVRWQMQGFARPIAHTQFETVVREAAASRQTSLSSDISPSNGETGLAIKSLTVSLGLAALNFVFSIILAHPRNTGKQKRP